MPRKLNIDISVLKAAFCKGLQLTELAKKYSVNIHTLRSIAKRDNWVQDKAKSDALVHQVSQDAGIQHVARISEIVSSKLDELAKYDFISNVKDLDAEGFTRCLNTLDLMKRRAHRLDEQATHKPSSLVQVNVTTNGASSMAWSNTSESLQAQAVLLADSDAPDAQPGGQDERDAQVVAPEQVTPSKPS